MSENNPSPATTTENQTKIDIPTEELPLPLPETSSPPKNWVKFEEEPPHNEPVVGLGPLGSNSNGTTANKPKGVVIEQNKSQDAPAVISTESVHVKLDNRSLSNNVGPLGAKPMRNVELPVATVEPIRQGFSNGDIIVTLLPVNTRFPWITPAQFRPELVPEELMAQGLTLTVEEYVQTMELLVNDVRFTLYNVCYKRVLVVWVLLAFSVLLGLLFSGMSGMLLFGLGIGWLILNAAAIFCSMWMKFKLSRNLERCLAHVNKQLLRHKIVVALDDRGKISCHKVNLCFLYMDSGPCVSHLQSTIDQQERDLTTTYNGWEQRMDVNVSDVVIQGSRTTRLSRKQERATLLYLRYASRWARQAVRKNLVSPPAKGGRHCHSLTCPCQFIQEHLMCKPSNRLTIGSFFDIPNQPTDLRNNCHVQ